MIELYEHNRSAYDSVLSLLSETGKAAVIHPTGTGKSFIAFKLAEDYPSSAYVWLSPSVNIYNTQLENIRKASGFIPRNITFFTYARLMNTPEEELANLHPDYIILDEFHRAGAAEWGKGVQTLLKTHPEAKLLGLSATHIRYLDDQRNMADELFDNCIADQMSLAEAVTRGILPAPKYVVSFYAYRLEEEKYRNRMNRVSLPVRRQAEEYLEKLRRALQNAEGLEEIFPKHMENPHGKYIVFCAGYDHMQEMMEKSAVWFKKVDEHPHLYNIWADSSSAEKDYQAFKNDCSDHLRLLFCIDMFNEGIHVEDLSGVILFRPTISPIIYKQQIGRALSAMQTGNNCTPVIFDIVNNFENLYAISSLEDETARVCTLHTNEPRTDWYDVNPFRIIDEVRDCRELFNRLEDTLGLSWHMMYQEAKKYYIQNGHLNVPKSFRTEDGIPLGIWIQTQRRIRNGTCNGLLTEERIHFLDQIGMVWKSKSETAWETGLTHAKTYRDRFNNLDVSARYISPDGYPLGKWICAARQNYAKLQNSSSDPLLDENIRQLDSLGMIWNKLDFSFQQGLQAAKEYAEQFGNLDVPLNYITQDGFKLGQWIQSQRTRKKQSHSKKEEQAQLDALGMIWEPKADRLWEMNYRKAKQFYDENRHLQIPCNYTINRTNLWRWLSRQKDAYKANSLEEEKIQKLEAIGIQWDTRSKSWSDYFELANNYFQTNGNLEIPPDHITKEGVWLGKWLANQRIAKSKNSLSGDQFRKLNSLGMRWTNKQDDYWDEMFISLTSWLKEENRPEIMPRNTKAKNGTNLFQWTRRQRLRRIKGKLLPYQRQKWDDIQPIIITALNLQKHSLQSGEERGTA